ncbi:MAG: DUF4428 domain-containing protein [Clostridia bacterium]|nr:DUF4428 domain-containing protein [Clostridia bacterium]
MGLFDKKFCDICGEKIGLLGNRKLEDGNLCKDCASKLSPWTTDRRHSTVEEIKGHLEYREQNKQMLSSIRPTKIIGDDTKVYIDQAAGKFFVTRFTDWRSNNPDIIDLSQVVSCNVNIDEDKREIYMTNSSGQRVSYNPRRYEVSYDFDVEIQVNSPWFSTIEFRLNDQKPDSPYTDLYREYERQANDLKCSLMPGTYGNMYPQGNMQGNFQQNGFQQNGYPMNNGFNNQNPNMNPAGVGFGAFANNGYQQNNPMQQQSYNNMNMGGIGNPNMQQFNGNMQQNNGSWICQSCGTSNSSNFCQGCGAQRTQTTPAQGFIGYRCDKCGWEPTDMNNIPRFCPVCGDPFDSKDLK